MPTVPISRGVSLPRFREQQRRARVQSRLGGCLRYSCFRERFLNLFPPSHADEILIGSVTVADEEGSIITEDMIRDDAVSGHLQRTMVASEIPVPGRATAVCETNISPSIGSMYRATLEGTLHALELPD